MNSESKENVLLSYPRSGNHLCRFFIELLSELPAYGCKGNPRDVPIHKNKFEEVIPFNIQTEFDKGQCFFKYHHPPKNGKTGNLILLIRNPREVLLNDYKKYPNECEWYFKDLEYYSRHQGKKIVMFYEDTLTNKQEFVETLYDFLELDKPDKKKYVLENLDKLFELSSQGKNRAWGGVNSNFQTDFYYKKIQGTLKNRFDSYLNTKLQPYQFVRDKYGI